MSTPVVPPRPTRKLDPSPVRSPLNAPPSAVPVSKAIPSSNLSAEDVPPRPPSVAALPTLGQEGAEYASFDVLPPEAHGVGNEETAIGKPEQTRNISEEMTLHAPKASLPQSTAKSRIQTVTRTDSTQAAAAGIGQSRPLDDVHKTPADSTTSVDRTRRTSEDLTRTISDQSTLKPVSSYNRPPSGASSRPGSIYESYQEQGIPHIGAYAPLNPNAGDVQAPSPGPTQTQFEKGVGFFNDGSSRAHNRKRSGRHEFSGPPGSYGLHNHSTEPHDQFEREWYAKNRDRAAMEQQNLYGRPKPETALSSAELNRIVTQGDDTGTAPIGTPGEELAFTASDAYTSRMSPKTSPTPTREPRKRLSSGSQPAVESSLRRTSYPFPKNQQAVEDDDVDTIHIDSPEYRTSRVTGGGPADGAVDLGAHAGNTPEEGGWFVERGTGTPILASDEVLKRHESATMQAAVNPEYQFDSYDEYAQYDNSRRNSMRVPSRPSSRPGSIHGDSYQGGSLHRYISHDDHHRASENHTPLEEIEEYEPLIPDGEDSSPKPRVKAKDVKRRPGIEHHHFPSRDIWEDTPSSMYYRTTVETPDIAPEQQTSPPGRDVAKDAETSNEQSTTAVLTEAKPPLKPHYATRAIDNRPGVQRFPSKDIWEDTPSSLYYSTTVGGPQMDQTKSEPVDRATTSAIPASQDDDEARATTGFTQVMRPQIPTRPQRRSKLAEEVKPDDEDKSEEALSREVSEENPPSPEKTKAPPIPDRPKPTVPVRPARSSRSGQANGAGAELTKTTSRELSSAVDGAAAAAPVPKAKPIVPARPGGEKIAAMKAGFMSDLNNRLKIGPQAAQPKSREIDSGVTEETSKEPLADARKGRAKGPARRKPAASPSATVEEKSAAFSISAAITLWSIDEQDKLQVPSMPSEPQATDAGEIPALEKATSSKVEDNPPEPAPAADLPQLEKVLSDNATANTEEAAPTESVSPVKTQALSSTEIAEASPEERKSIQTRLEASLAEVGAGPAPTTTITEKDVASPTEIVQQTETEASEKTIGDEKVAEDEIQGVAAS